MTAAIYARVSTDDQNCSLQLRDLRETAARNGWDTVEYMDMESTRKRRPKLEELLKDAKARKFDVVLCWKLDRFGRSVKELLANIEMLDLAGIRFMAGIVDTDKRNPGSRLMLHILAAVAEFERDLIRERVTAGVAEYQRAYKAGRVGADRQRQSRSSENRAHGRPKKVFDRLKVEELRESGMSERKIAEALGLKKTVVHDYLASLKPAA